MTLDVFRRVAQEGHTYCVNEECEVVGQLKEFKVCPQCKTARYCATRARNRIGMRVGTRKHVAPARLTKSPSTAIKSFNSEPCSFAALKHGIAAMRARIWTG